MAQRISEQVAEYLTLGGDGFPSQTSVPLHVQGHTILGTTQTNNNDDNYKANLTTINGHLIINASYNNHNNYSQGIRINKGTNNRALLMLGGDTGSTYGTSDTTWHIGTFPNSNNSSITDLIIARNDCQFNNEKPSLQLTNDGLTVYKRVVVDSKTSGSANAGFYLKGGSSAGSDIYSQMYISSIGVAGNSSPGIAVLELGNNKSANTTNNAKGQLRLWGSGNKYSNIETKATANRTAYLPDVSGWLVMGGNGSSTGVGNSNTPVYIKTTGVADTVSNSVLTNLSSTTAGNIYTAEPRPGVTGTLAVTNGGTGQTSFTANRLVYASGSTSIASLQNIYVTDGQIGIGRMYSGTNSLTVDGDSEFYGNIYIDEDLEIGGTLEVVGGSFIGGSNVTDYQGNLSKIIDSSSGNRFLTVAPYHSFSSNSWNINNDSKCIEIDFPTGLSGISIGFWIDFYSSTGIGSYCIYGEIPNNTNANSPWEHCHAFCMGSSNITQFPVLFCKDNNNGNSNKYKIFIGNGSSNIVKNIRERNFVIRDMTIHNISNIFNQQLLHSNLIITPKLLTSFPESGIDIDFSYYSPSIGDTPDYIYRITAINRDFKLQIFSGMAPFYYFDRNGNNICSANSNYYEYEKFGSLIPDREYLIKFKVINSSSGRINITHTFNLQHNETYTLPSSNGNSIGFTSRGFYSQALQVSNYDLHKGETVEISCTLV